MPSTLSHTAYTQGWPEPYVCTVYDRMYGDFPAENTVCTPYTPINVWFWPTLHISYAPRAGQNHIYTVYVPVFFKVDIPYRSI